MDMVKTLQSEIFRPFVILVIPGAIAVAPYLFLLIHFFPSIVIFFSERTSLAWMVGSGAIIAAGLIIEDVGSEIEARLLDRFQENRQQHEDDWFAYLCIAFVSEPVGHRYLRTIVLKLKYELHMAIGFLLFMLGLWWVNYCESFLTCSSLLGISLVLLLVCSYLLWESYSSARVLGRVRHKILEGVKKMPF